MKHVVLVGATDGIGRALAHHYAEQGWRVGVLGRDAGKLARLADRLSEEAPGVPLGATALCDVTDHERVGPALDELLADLGQMDLLVYCAGVLEQGETPEASSRAARRMLDVNCAGAVHVLELAADYFADAGRGHVAALGSVAGERGRKGNPGYCASKAALHAYLEGLRHRLHGSGVTVSTVKPGWVKTRMLEDHEKPGAVTPATAARKIAHGLERGREVFYVPGWWRLVGAAIRWTPRFLFKRVGPP